MNAKSFKEKMSGAIVLLAGWRSVTNKKLVSGDWVNYLRLTARSLIELADEMELDMAKENK